jgi:excisionase family DNA binding protein
MKQSLKRSAKELISDFFKTRMLTTSEASNYLNLCIPYVRKLAYNGKIVSYKPGGKNLYFDIEDLDNYLRANRRMSEAEISSYALKFNLKHTNTAF